MVALQEETIPRGDKSAYTDKQKRQAEHIEESCREHGTSEDRAEQIAWATVNKWDGGGKSSNRSEADKRGWETRRRNEKSK